MKRPDISFASLQARVKALLGAHAPSKKGIAPVRDWALVLTLVTCGLCALFVVGGFEYLRADVSVDVEDAPAVRPYALPDESALQGMVEAYEARSTAFEALLEEGMRVQPEPVAPEPVATSSEDGVQEAAPVGEEPREVVDDVPVPEIVP